MSYFAKPNFIVYDEWFDNNLEKTKFNVKNKKIETISNIHEFFYEQSNFKVGASENNFELDIKVNEKKFLNNNIKNSLSKYTSSSSNEFSYIRKPSKRKIEFNITNKIIYSLSIFGILFILGFLLFSIAQSQKKESKIINKFFDLEQRIFISKTNP